MDHVGCYEFTNRTSIASSTHGMQDTETGEETVSVISAMET